MHDLRPRRFLVLVAIVSGAVAGTLAATPAQATDAGPTAAPAPAVPTTPPHAAPASDPLVDAALAALAAAVPGEARLAAAARVIDLGAAHQPALAQRLVTTRIASDDARRQVLTRIRAEVPGRDGVFRTPPRPDTKKKQAPVELDWLAELAPLTDEAPAVDEVIEVVALLRALAATRTDAAAVALLEFSFSDDGLAFRDECGRSLRRMSPDSLATLLRAARDQKRARGSYARYAAYQLDRLDKARPSYALAAAPDARVTIAILRALGDGQHPDAVPDVLARTDAASPAVRQAARTAWASYVSGAEPPPAPKRKRKLPGGKLSDQELPLYLTFRELADIEARRVLAIELGEEPARRDTLVAMTERLFTFYDERRGAAWNPRLDELRTHAEAGRWDDARKIADEVLLEAPLHTRRAELAGTFIAVGRRLRDESRFAEAALAYDRAVSVAPSGPFAREATAELHYCRGRAQREDRVAADDDLARAVELAPAKTPVRQAARAELGELRRAQAGARARWMLWAGLASGTLALTLLGFGLVRRRQGTT